MNPAVMRGITLGIKGLCKLSNSVAKSETGQEISKNIDSALEKVFNKVGENIKKAGNSINSARENRLSEKAKSGNPEDIYMFARYLEIEKNELEDSLELYFLAGNLGHYKSQQEAARLVRQIELFKETNAIRKLSTETRKLPPEVLKMLSQADKIMDFIHPDFYNEDDKNLSIKIFECLKSCSTLNFDSEIAVIEGENLLVENKILETIAFFIIATSSSCKGIRPYTRLIDTFSKLGFKLTARAVSDFSVQRFENSNKVNLKFPNKNSSYNSKNKSK